MMRRSSTIFAAIALCCTSQSGAQLSLPVGSVPGLPGVGSIPGSINGRLDNLLDRPLGEIANTLRLARLDRIETLVSNNRVAIERDMDNAPARRGVIVLVDPDPATLQQVRALGLLANEPEMIDGLGVTTSQITLPAGMSLAAAQKLLTKKIPQATIASDQIFFQSGTAAIAPAVTVPANNAAIATPVGLIDGAAAQPVRAVKGFASGAPYPSNHGSAVAALAYSAGARNILVADVYGTDPAGGNALAIARGMGWLLDRGAKVISISLVGPRNPLLERAVTAARDRGAVIVAAVGNDGPAAPPAYPASYKDVLAITAVDKRNRPLIEAGRATHLDYAAPGTDIAALDRTGKLVPVRGTSFAAPLVAARAAAMLDRGATVRTVAARLDAEAIPLARRRPDPRTGRGLLCAGCR